MDFNNYLSCVLANDVAKLVGEEICVGETRLNFISEGVIEITPSRSTDFSSAVIYSCGIHGNETAPIEILNDLLTDIKNQKVIINKPLLLIFGHLEAMRKGARFIEDNLNRMFSDAYLNYPNNLIEAPRAKIIQDEITRFFDKYKKLDKIHYDLHTAIRPSKYKRFAVYPFLDDGRDISKDQLHLFKTMGIDAVLFMNKSSPTLSYYSSNVHGANAFTLELGKVEKFGQNNRNEFSDAERILRAIVTEDNIKMYKDLPVLCAVKKELIRHEEDYKFNVDDETPNFTSFRKGEVRLR